MNIILLLLFKCVAAKVFGGYSKGYYFRVNLKAKFTLSYVLPGSTNKQRITVDADNEFEEVALVLENLAKAHIKFGDFSLWLQVTLKSEYRQIFRFDWIQLLYKNNGNKLIEIEIGRITGPLYFESYFLIEGDRKYMKMDNKLFGQYMEPFDIDVLSLCINTAWGWWNPMGYYDECIYPLQWAPKPIPPPTREPPIILTTKSTQPVTTKTLQNLTNIGNESVPQFTLNKTESYIVTIQIKDPIMNISYKQNKTLKHNDKSLIEKRGKRFYLLIGGIIIIILTTIIAVIFVFLCIRKRRADDLKSHS